MNHSLRLGLLVAAALALSACDRNPVDKSAALVTVNGQAITQNDVTNYLQTRPAPAGADQDQERHAALDDLVDAQLLAQSAIKQKLDQEPNVYFTLKRERENVLAAAAFDKYMGDHPITDADIAQRYNEEARKTDRTEYRVRQIQFTDEADAKQAIAALRLGRDFATLARHRSADVATARNGGELGWLNQADLASVPQIEAALKKMKKGQYSLTPVKTQFGWHVLQLEDTRVAPLPSLTEAKTNIMRTIERERLQTLLANLRKQATIKTAH